ncbi:MAG: phosphorylase [Thermoplasmata archaeon]|jgi:AMP phosphorylase|nr:phosphorylase [Thermoplasmata archaeon]
MEGKTLEAHLLDIDLGKFQVLLHRSDAEELGVHPGDRVRVLSQPHAVIAVVDVTESVVQPGTMGVFADVRKHFSLDEGARLHVRPAEKPQSVGYIKRKMHGKKLDRDEIDTIVQDVVEGSLTDVELSAWVTSLEINDMDMEEIEHLTRSMVKHGEVLDFGDNAVVFDKHSIGGVPGNKISLLIVPIVAAAGLMIPKTSSRAVTGAAGTADVMEVFGPVALSGPQIRKITEEVGGVLCWGGGVNLAPADDIIIRVEHPLSIDPRSQLLASVMSKKKAVGANKVVMDLPMGEGTKLATLEDAKKIGRQFIELGERLDMQVECAVTYGGQPVGKAVGCALEANEALQALRGLEAPKSLIEKSAAIAGIILEMGNVVGKGKGKARAEEILKSGAALEKFREIVEAQRGVLPKGDVPVGQFTGELQVAEGGYVAGVRNKAIINIARAAGSPKEHGAGLVLHHKRGDKVQPGESVMTIYAESAYKLELALALARKTMPVIVEGMLLQRLSDVREL